MKVEQLSKNMDTQVVLDKVTFDIKKGEIVALIGRNGVGKTTLFRTMLDLYQRDSGEKNKW